MVCMNMVNMDMVYMVCSIWPMAYGMYVQMYIATFIAHIVPHSFPNFAISPIIFKLTSNYCNTPNIQLTALKSEERWNEYFNSFLNQT